MILLVAMLTIGSLAVLAFFWGLAAIAMSADINSATFNRAASHMGKTLWFAVPAAVWIGWLVAQLWRNRG